MVSLGPRRTQALEGPWLLATDPDNCGRQRGWQSRIQEAARLTRVPGVIQETFPGYHGVVWYWHRFHCDCAMAPEERALLRFCMVEYHAQVWLNGQPVGSHEGGEGAFELDVTASLRPGGDNLLTVRVLDPTGVPIDGLVHAEVPHSMRDGAFSWGGIYTPVELHVVPAVRIADVFARPCAETGEVHLAVTVRNDSQPTCGILSATAGAQAQSGTEATTCAHVDLPLGDSVHRVSLTLPAPRLWDLADPYLYRLNVVLEAAREDGSPSRHEHATTCGFRDFRVRDGFFYLNGRRVFVRCAHYGKYYPVGQVVPLDPDHMRRDLYLAKACGFNMVRFLANVAFPEQLDYCDQIGLMVYEECSAAWGLEDSPHMAQRFDLAVREMVVRDRNHPCLTMWGMLNETPDGPVFRHAVNALSLLRELDPTRLVLLGSGRWDDARDIGSVCNPGSAAWEHAWGAEGLAGPSPHIGTTGGYHWHAGDAHIYPAAPLRKDECDLIRSVGKGTRPVFISECGIGSLNNAIEESKRFAELHAPDDLADLALSRDIAARFLADWQRWGMDGLYPFPEDMLRESYRLHSHQRRRLFDLIRANPQVCGYSMTQLLEGPAGEGVFTHWRELKPGIAEALRDGWAPLRWCLFVTPGHVYAGKPFQVEAVLANEAVLGPGTYHAHLRMFGPEGLAWERRTRVRITAPPAGQEAPLAVPVLRQRVTLSGPPGEYTFAACLERGGVPQGDRLTFHLDDAACMPNVRGTVVLWGLDRRVRAWLEAAGLRCRDFAEAPPRRRELVLVGAPARASGGQWRDLVQRLMRGSTAVFLSPRAFGRGEDAVHWMPLARKGRIAYHHDWLYHKESVAKRHPVFEGLQCGGIMDWEYYQQVISHELYEPDEEPAEVIAAAFAPGYWPEGYVSGLHLCVHSCGAGRFVVNTLNILPELGRNPAADRLLLNLIRYGQHDLGGRQCGPLRAVPRR